MHQAGRAIRAKERCRNRVGAWQATTPLALTPTEIYLLDQLVGDTPGAASAANPLALYLTKLARLGGYLVRAKDPPPGNTVMWRGITRLTTSKSASSLELNLWVIERKNERLHLRRLYSPEGRGPFTIRTLWSNCAILPHRSHCSFVR